jgi:hypothetical protein
MATKRTKQHRRNESADFGDEDAVLAEVAAALDEDPEDLKIEEDRGLTSFGEGVAYRISGRGRGSKHGGREWIVVESDDAAHELAKASVTQDLEHEPEIFNKDFLESHINKDLLRRDLASDVRDMAEEDLRDSAERDPERFWDDAERYGMERQYVIKWDSPDGDGELPEKFTDSDAAEDAGAEWQKEALAAANPDDGYKENDFSYSVEDAEPDDVDIENLAEKIAEERLEDPIAYLEDIYGDEAAAKAIEIAGIDIDAAAEEAVDTDGWQHFLSRYDGNSYETKSGFVYWRDN